MKKYWIEFWTFFLLVTFWLTRIFFSVKYFNIAQSTDVEHFYYISYFLLLSARRIFKHLNIFIHFLTTLYTINRIHECIFCTNIAMEYFKMGLKLSWRKYKREEIKEKEDEDLRNYSIRETTFRLALKQPKDIEVKCM